MASNAAGLNVKAINCYSRGSTALRLGQANAFNNNECLLVHCARGSPPLADIGLNVDNSDTGAKQLVESSAKPVATSKKKGKRSIEAIRKKRLTRNKRKREAHPPRRDKTNAMVKGLIAEMKTLQEEHAKEKSLITAKLNNTRVKTKSKSFRYVG